jgi:hypothetical protein
MERGDEEAALAQEHGLAVELSEHLDVGAGLAQPRGADEDAPERLVVTRELEVGLEARDLTAVGIPVDEDVDEVEVRAVEHDHPGAGSEDRRAESPHRLVEAVEPHQPHERRRLAARDHEPVEPVELAGDAHLDGLGAEPPQHGRVLAEVALDGEDTDARTLHVGKSRAGASGHVSRRRVQTDAAKRDLHSMAYEWDVFLSYRRFGEWPGWVHKHFQSLLTHWLGEELGDVPRMFVDVEVLESGANWPDQLANGLANSKAMVALWSRQYFSSRWCTAELQHMIEREKACGIGSEGSGGRLVVPAVIHDGQDIPPPLKVIHYLELQELSNPRIASDSSTGEKLSEAIRGWAPSVKAAIERAPEWNESWRSVAQGEFGRVYREQPKQTSVPGRGEAT